MERKHASAPAVRIRDLVGEPLEFRQPSIWKRFYELRNGDTVVGSLSFRSFLSDEARAECGDGCWTLTSKGIWKRELLVTPCEEEKPIFTAPYGFFAKSLTFKLQKYRTLTLKQNFWSTQYTLTSGMQQKVIFLKTRSFSFGAADVIIEKKSEEFEEIPWILFVIYYKALHDKRSRSGAH